MAARIALVLVALAAGLGLAACGDDEGGDGTTTETTTLETTTTTTDETTTTTDEETTTAAGRSVFVANCGSCHTLADAETSGAVGPNLDDATLEMQAVEQQVRQGGGGMPAFEDTLSDEEIVEVAEYVVAAQRS